MKGEKEYLKEKEIKETINRSVIFFSVGEKKNNPHSASSGSTWKTEYSLGIDCSFGRVVMNMFKLSCDRALKIQISQGFHLFIISEQPECKLN